MSGSNRPVGALSGKAAYLNPGHGYVWRDSNYWGLQRGFVHNNIEDFSNVDTVNQYLFAYLYNAGADVFSVRELDPNPNMVVVDNDDESTGYVEQGNWFSSSLKGYKNGHAPYVNGQNPFSFGTNRLHKCVVGNPTASVAWIPEIPSKGWYNVYVSHAAYTNRSPRSHYRVYHAGGTTECYLDQRRRRFTWIYLGTFFFEAGFKPGASKVVLFNDSSSSEHYISADAVRFGGGMGLISRGTVGTSGKPRYEEEARYHIQYCGAPDYDGSRHDEADGWSARPRFGRWLKQGAEAYGAPPQDSVFHKFFIQTPAAVKVWEHMFIQAPKIPGMMSYATLCTMKSCMTYITAIASTFKNHGVGKRYGSYSENNPKNVGDLMPIFLGEWIFHDSADDMEMYHDPKFRQALARAIYQGVVKFWAKRNGTHVQLLPEPPRNFRCIQVNSHTVRLSWDPPLYNKGDNILGDAATGYRLYQGTHGRAFPAGQTYKAPQLISLILPPTQTTIFMCRPPMQVG